MKPAEKLDLAQWARDTVVPMVRAKGKHHPAGVEGPARWRMDTSELMLIYAEGTLLGPDDRSLSCLLDIWTAQGTKMFSLSWEADRPWQPFRIVRTIPGPWLEDLRRMVGQQA